MKKLFTILTLLCCFSITTQAQSKSGTYGLQVETGYTFELKFNTGRNTNYQAFNIAISPGYNVTDKLFAGVGMALYDYRYSEKGVTVMGIDKPIDIQNNFISVPVYAHGLWKFGRGDKAGVFVSLKAGYGIISKSTDQMKGPGGYEIPAEDYSGGLYLSPSVGYKYSISNKQALSLSVSYDHQDYTVTSKANGREFEIDKTNSTIGVKVGWAF